ncbi:uncharacterized protein BDZ99DRAFT_156835 [Mytilinidion resinicola]|uniref:EthD domain-containing protein n=1 Tax=Mytilinidion resinicola TaxID=574789 RepID=A0A6A6Y706_9PEZI|nr:uncharacterized protein BDZ99DRAFT_156835 [Mytilinidion resinicola]KAF2803975.1 hypothetical protein BDZ99DRAFT_156835 [Mytilinidion resinicola]
MAARAILLLKKLDTLTDAEFYKYMEGTHSDSILKVPYIKEKNITFSSFRVDKVLSSSIGFPMSEFDGEFNFWCSSMEDLIDLFSDPEWQRIVVDDGANFNEQQEGRMMIGYDTDLLPDRTGRKLL